MDDTYFPQIRYPQLREVDMKHVGDSEGYDTAKLVAIDQPSEKEYLNAILSDMHTRFHWIERGIWVIIAELLIIGGYLIFK